MLNKANHFFHISENYKPPEIFGVHVMLFHDIINKYNKYIQFFYSKVDEDYVYGFCTKSSELHNLEYSQWKYIYSMINNITQEFNKTLDTKKYKIIILNHRYDEIPSSKK